MVHHKKWLVVGAAAAVALGCIGIVLAPNETAAVVTQIHVPTAPASKANITSAIVAAGTMLSAALIRSGDIDNAAAREANENAVVSIRDLMAERGLWIFTGSVVLFHFANAAMLPLVGELLSKGQDGRSSIYMSACIIAAQFVMIPVPFTTGNLADKWGRKPLFLFGSGFLPPAASSIR